ncbi:MAG: DNA (cytosine-5-)-methyltransferase [Phenylobacterium sp.]|uniref:DNA cytosine methyltransferase n=1 Tax=Phenylobacterium sp. TaxID=1871053 RepID=UPI002732FA2C|nr:DNA (cytosine-5-)-methyltransferase [Phenylobacterium sp.]MDP3745612.1 DNA (cytosine-5-)-methyltransferase [Phenylobacterium sp.]
MSTSRPPRAISLFTGVGGLDFGFEAAGFETAVAIEWDRIACETLRLNRSWPVLEGDIHQITSEEILRAGGLKAGEADILIGGPPCQPFSKSGYWVAGDARRLDDPRASTLHAYLRVVEDTLPKSFLLENVHGLAFKGKDEGLQFLLAGIADINRRTGANYVVTWAKLNAADYGVPQMRERVFLVGSREGVEFKFPTPTHFSVPSGGQEPWRTAWDAIGDLAASPNEAGLAMGGRWAELLPSIPEGENYLWHTSRGGGVPLFGWRTRYWSFLLKLAKDRPSWTIQAQPGSAIGPFHWSNRRLSTLELCRLQTFPPELQFNCGRANVQKLLGNAVPSLLAEVMARQIKAQLLERPVTGALKLIPPKRKAAFNREPTSGVAAKYMHLVGDHAEHPGEGMGNRARARRAA